MLEIKCNRIVLKARYVHSLACSWEMDHHQDAVVVITSSQKTSFIKPIQSFIPKVTKARINLRSPSTWGGMEKKKKKVTIKTKMFLNIRSWWQALPTAKSSSCSISYKTWGVQNDHQPKRYNSDLLPLLLLSYSFLPLYWVEYCTPDLFFPLEKLNVSFSSFT